MRPIMLHAKGVCGTVITRCRAWIIGPRDESTGYNNVPAPVGLGRVGAIGRGISGGGRNICGGGRIIIPARMSPGSVNCYVQNPK